MHKHKHIYRLDILVKKIEQKYYWTTWWPKIYFIRMCGGGGEELFACVSFWHLFVNLRWWSIFTSKGICAIYVVLENARSVIGRDMLIFDTLCVWASVPSWHATNCLKKWAELLKIIVIVPSNIPLATIYWTQYFIVQHRNDWCCRPWL